MNMKLTSGQYQRVNQGLKALHEGAADPQQSAKERLHGMAVDMVDKKGNVKSGYIKLVNDSDNQLRLGTRWSKKADTSTNDALTYVRDLVSQAYGEDSPAMAAITQYTQAKGDRIGTHSFVKLVRDLEAVNPDGNSRVDRLLHARVKGDATMQTDAFAAHPMQEMLLGQLPPADPAVAAPPGPANPLERASWTVLGRHYQLDMASKRSGADGHVVMGFNLADPADQVCLKIDKPVSKPGQELGTAVENRIFNRLQAAGPTHPNIVKRLDYQPSSHVLVLEKCKGSLLQETTGPLQMPQMGQRAAWFSQTRQAMEHLHSQGIVHRDLNTKNVLVREDGTAAMADFGNAYDFHYANSKNCMDSYGNAQNLDQASSAERRDLIKLGYNLLAGGDKAPPPSVTTDSAKALLAGLPANEVQRLTPLLQQAFRTYHAQPAASPEATRKAVAALGEVLQRLGKLAAR